MLAHHFAHHNLWLVALAAVVCVGGSLTTFTIYAHVIARGSQRRIMWVPLTGFCAGAGIWATHFIDMLAHESGQATGYDPFPTATSFAVAVAVSTMGVAISLGRRRAMIAAGGAIIGLGIAAMHFIGMQALILQGTFEWNAALITLAIVVGVTFAVSALLAYRLQSGMSALLSGSILLTLGICSLHFTAMAALTIVPTQGAAAPTSEFDSEMLAATVASTTALALLAGYFVALINGRAMHESFERFGELVEAVIEGLVVADDGVIVNINGRALMLCRRKRHELIGKNVFGHLLAQAPPSLSSSGTHRFNVPLLRADDTPIPVEVVRRPLRGLFRGNEIYAIRDLREREAAARQLAEADQELQRSEQDLCMRNLLLENALSTMSQGLCIFDNDRRVGLCNERFSTIYDLPADAIRPGMHLTEVIQKRIDNGRYAGQSPAAYMREWNEPPTEAENCVHELCNGQVIAIARRMMPGGGWVTTHEDITELKRLEAEVTHLAETDALTGLPSRTSIRDRLTERLEAASELAVLVLGMDRFGEINAALGHAAGDAVLKSVAQRLQDSTRRATLLGRFGDDTFVVVEAVKQATEGTGFAQRLQSEIRKPLEIAESTLELTATIGMAVYPTDGKDADTLLKNAVLAMKRGKSEGCGTLCFFSPAMDAELRDRRALEQDLAAAVEKRQFDIQYQPLVNLARNEIAGFEALLRWQHPVRGVVPPAEFMPVAEQTGLIHAIGDRALRQACAEAMNWPKDLIVSVGVSVTQFRSPKFVGSLTAILKATGLKAARLEIEITEKELHDNQDQAIKTLQQLSDLGVLISFNKFGAGLSSFTHLRKFLVHKIKIDKSFLPGSSKQQESQIFLRTLARLGVGMGMVTTVDGVETKEQLDIARAEGCTEMQGVCFGQPRTAEEIRSLFQKKIVPGLA